jgi:hypothetical protein
MPAQQLKLKQATRLWLLTGESNDKGGFDVWWPVNNPAWQVYEAGTVFEATWARIVDGMVLIVELKGSDGTFAGFDVDEPFGDTVLFNELFEVVAVSLDEVAA